MNHCYRLVFNKSTQVWQVVSEIAKSHRKSAAIVLLPLLNLFSGSTAWAEPAANALPTGGQVVSGQSAITQSGQQLNIVQTSQKSIINWQSYNIGSHSEVNYVQNNASAISLNRVITGDPSAIFGKLNANGQVWLINPNGVLFGKGAQVNVGGLLASTLNIADDDFSHANYQFTGSNGSVVNMGAISASQGGYVAMLAPEVRNEGVISAMQGSVVMAAGNAMTLDFNGNGLINVQVDSANMNTLVENKHLIQVGNGQVLMSAKAADGLITSVVNNSGKIEANSMVNDGGVIRLTGAKTVINSGEISAISASQKGGTVHLLGDNVGIFNSASINVSGKTGGGTILVGGDTHGVSVGGKNLNPQNASKTFVHQDAQLIADATESGHGGKVIVWADDIARYYGSVSAKGGAVAGNGGFVEISGKRLLNFLGNVDVSATHGMGGNLLLDPLNITLSDGADTNTTGFTVNTDNTEAFADDAGLDSIFNVLTGGSFSGISAGSTITLQATNDITIVNAFNVATATGSANNSLVLEANNNINVNAALTLDGTGALTLRADADNSGAGNLAINAAIATDIGGANLFGANVTSTTSGSINTTGTFNTSSGNVNITATDSINLETNGFLSNIVTSGFSSIGNNGQNAGNISLVAGQSITTVGSISFVAEGGNGAGTGNQSGGNGGLVSVTANTGIHIFSIQARGGDSVGAGTSGNSGNITVRNQDNAVAATGDIVIRGNTALRAGQVTGSGAGGNAGDLIIQNQANSGNVTTSLIAADGRINSHGSDVSITSEAGVNITSSINTSAGLAFSGNAARNAGNLTIVGENRTVAGAITANGGAGNGTDQAGGHVGQVSITGAGTLNVAAINAKSGSATGGGLGGLAGNVMLSGSSITATTLDVSPGTNGFGGTVNLTTTGSGNSSVQLVNINNFGAVNINNTDRLTIVTGITGLNGSVTKSGTGSLIYAGANDYTGLTSIDTGILQIGNGATSGSLVNTGGIANNGTVIFNRSDTHSYAGAVSGTGDIDKDGAGSFTFGTGAKTYTGATNIKAGTFISNSAIANDSAVNVSAGAILDLNNRNEIVGSISGAGQIVMGTANLTSGRNHLSTTFSGEISGTGGNFNKQGSGTLTLIGNNNYTGITNVEDGVLVAASANALGTIAGGTVIGSGATLEINDLALAAEAITLASNAILNATGNVMLTGNVSVADNSKIGTTSFVSSLTIDGVVTAALGETLEIIGDGSLSASNAANNFEMVRIVSAKDVTLHDVNSVSFSTTPSNLTGHLAVNAANAITLLAAGGVTSSTGNIALTSDTFVNNAGANALVASNGRWVVHTAAVADNIYGDLASGNQAVWGRALNATIPENGNRYIFVQSPTIDLTSIDLSKTYGQNATTLVADAFTATGFIDASIYGGVFTQDNIANALTGDATSVGSVETANVGSYAIDVTPITATTGYALNKSNAGNLTVNAATLNLNAVTDSKVYDGTTNSSGIVATVGLMNGDTIDDLTQSYNSKNVLGLNGSTLQVNTGYSVNDGNNGNNYTININTVTGTGTITPLGLTGSITANDKIYDANVSASIATRTLAGVIGSDSVNYAGGRATFADQNAGMAKTVTALGLSLAGADAGNYTVNTTANTTATINQANLSIAANNATKVQGNVNPAFTSTYTGFVGGETANVLGGTLHYATLANSNSPVGDYTVTPFGVISDNYAIRFFDATLSVTELISVVDFNDLGAQISPFNNATTRPEQAIPVCQSQGAGQAMINGLDAFGLDDVDYDSQISQPQVGGVIANALVRASCSKL